MREIVSLGIMMIIAAIVYELVKPKKDYKSTNQQSDLDDDS